MYIFIFFRPIYLTKQPINKINHVHSSVKILINLKEPIKTFRKNKSLTFPMTLYLESLTYTVER